MAIKWQSYRNLPFLLPVCICLECYRENIINIEITTFKMLFLIVREPKKFFISNLKGFEVGNGPTIFFLDFFSSPIPVGPTLVWNLLNETLPLIIVGSVATGPDEFAHFKAVFFTSCNQFFFSGRGKLIKTSMYMVPLPRYCRCPVDDVLKNSNYNSGTVNYYTFTHVQTCRSQNEFDLQLKVVCLPVGRGEPQGTLLKN